MAEWATGSQKKASVCVEESDKPCMLDASVSASPVIPLILNRLASAAEENPQSGRLLGACSAETPINRQHMVMGYGMDYGPRNPPLPKGGGGQLPTSAHVSVGTIGLVHTNHSKRPKAKKTSAQQQLTQTTPWPHAHYPPPTNLQDSLSLQLRFQNLTSRCRPNLPLLSAPSHPLPAISRANLKLHYYESCTQCVGGRFRTSTPSINPPMGPTSWLNRPVPPLDNLSSSDEAKLRSCNYTRTFLLFVSPLAKKTLLRGPWGHGGGLRVVQTPTNEGLGKFLALLSLSSPPGWNKCSSVRRLGSTSAGVMVWLLGGPSQSRYTISPLSAPVPWTARRAAPAAQLAALLPVQSARVTDNQPVMMHICVSVWADQKTGQAGFFWSRPLRPLHKLRWSLSASAMSYLPKPHPPAASYFSLSRETPGARLNVTAVSGMLGGQCSGFPGLHLHLTLSDAGTKSSYTSGGRRGGAAQSKTIHHS
ncbi:unnamed protein product [Pleuronectes platessa]|uniref:Uncharacterized protein n=1 Tax=Pleuronectes platessa TaxID=8262 RepID=A0A9N7V0H4_PLEPL|nr:unnamed protein product [Pleuronectes platessa]